MTSLVKIALSNPILLKVKYEQSQVDLVAYDFLHHLIRGCLKHFWVCVSLIKHIPPASPYRASKPAIAKSFLSVLILCRK